MKINTKIRNYKEIIEGGIIYSNNKLEHVIFYVRSLYTLELLYDIVYESDDLFEVFKSRFLDKNELCLWYRSNKLATGDLDYYKTNYSNRKLITL